MTDLAAHDAPSRSWWTRPAVVLPVVAALVVLAAITTPEAPQSGRIGDDRLSSHLTGSMGARLLFELSQRLGWHAVQRDSSPVPTSPPGRTIHAVLAPPGPITRAQAHLYMEAVRKGDALLIAVEARTPLTDSLGIRHAAMGGILTTPAEGSVEANACTTTDRTPTLWADGQVHLYGITRVSAEAPPDTFATTHWTSKGRETQAAAAIGFPLGQGRVVAVSDPDLLRNDVLRRCAFAADLIAVRMLEWLRDGGSVPRTVLEFDEYHQGYGPRSSAKAVVGSFLLRHPVGRTILVLALSGLVLLIAAAPRPLSPAQRKTVERRDPLEQVDALAHAYEQVGATRTAVLRLLHGVRSRVERGGALSRGRDDDRFLDDAVAIDAERAEDAAMVRRALRETATRSDLPTVGAALRPIEHTFTTRRA